MFKCNTVTHLQTQMIQITFKKKNTNISKQILPRSWKHGWRRDFLGFLAVWRDFTVFQPIRIQCVTKSLHHLEIILFRFVLIQNGKQMEVSIVAVDPKKNLHLKMKSGLLKDPDKSLTCVKKLKTV